MDSTDRHPRGMLIDKKWPVLRKNPWIHNKPNIQKPLEFHTAINFDFERNEWFQDDLLRTKLVEDDHWWTDDEYKIKYPILRDSLGILTCNWFYETIRENVLKPEKESCSLTSTVPSCKLVKISRFDHMTYKIWVKYAAYDIPQPLLANSGKIQTRNRAYIGMFISEGKYF